MSNPNTDRDGRVARIRKLNQMRRDNGSTALAPEILDDIDYLLSLLDTQAAEVIALRKEVAASERYQALLLDQPDATRMRDRCLEKVKQMRGEWESTRNGLEPLSKKRNRYDARILRR